MSHAGRSNIGTDPYAVAPAERDPARRFRGRLPAPVTIWTASTPDGERIGLTVSSVWVVEGEPARIVGLLGPLSDFADAVRASRRFVVHIIGADQVRVADVFAGRYPAPDPFAGLDVEDSAWGPLLVVGPDRAYCSLESTSDLGWSLLADATVDRFEIGATPGEPLAHYRGDYTTLTARRPRH